MSQKSPLADDRLLSTETDREKCLSVMSSVVVVAVDFCAAEAEPEGSVARPSLPPNTSSRQWESSQMLDGTGREGGREGMRKNQQ